MKRTLKGIRGLVMAFVAASLSVSCGKRGDVVATDLGDAGYELTREDWFRATRANDVAAMKRFVSGDFDPSQPDGAGNTALHAAAEAGAIEAADYLLNRGISIDVPGAAERTPLMAAVVSDQTAMVAWLLRQGADPRAKDHEGFSPLLLAVREGKTGPVEEIAPYDRDSLDSALLLAAMLGETAVIDALTNYGASVYARMEDGRTPLMLAAENGHTESVELLMDIGASRFTTDNQGRSAAQIALENEEGEIAALLSREPRPDELALDSPSDVAESMAAYVAAAANETPEAAEKMIAQTDDGQITSDVGERAATLSRSPVTSLDGETVSDPIVSRSPASAERAAPRTSPSAALPPLIMRHYREREIPLVVRSVEDEVATVRLQGAPDREVQVREGETIPGTQLVVVKVLRRMESSKVSLGESVEVSVMEVRDSTTGETREWIAGMPASAHDPVALVEDATTGRRYLAAPGQDFRSSDGTRYTVTDVRPNQLVIENADTGAVETLPLRGPRG